MPTGIYKRNPEQLKRLKDLANKPRKLRNGGYFAIHKWLIKHYGKANKCENQLCCKTRTKYHYALIKKKT